jgi:DNA transposition AAA+ family ATPase
MARRNRNFSVMPAYVGTGKTFALKYYAKHNPNTFMLEADPSMTPQTIVKELARNIIGQDAMGTNYELFKSIVNELENTDSLLIIDEAETLTPKQLHIIRRIRDKSNIGVVLAGTEYLAGLIKPEHGQFDQIRSRAGFWPETVKKITRDDSAALIQAAFPNDEITDEVIDRLIQYSAGSARMLVEGLIANLHQFRKEHELDVKLIDAVASQALCLQPIK